jgi:hypothetical protein
LSFSFARSLAGRILNEVVEIARTMTKIKTMVKGEDGKTNLWRTVDVGVAVFLAAGLILVIF